MNINILDDKVLTLQQNNIILNKIKEYITQVISNSSDIEIYGPQYATYEDLIAEHETGEAGDAYLVGTDTNPDLYVWLADTEEWYNAGKIAGVKGDPGDSIFGFDENGVYMTIEEAEEETQNGE